MQKKSCIITYILTVLVLSAAFVAGVVGKETASAEKPTSVSGLEQLATGQAVSGQVVEVRPISGSSVSVEGNPCVVTTASGKVQGEKTKKVYKWLGIPYGKTERWKAPTAPDSWSGIRSVRKNRKGKGDDCLFVNIYKPLHTVEPMPVMVFLHGGGNVGGTANRSFSEFVKETGVIVVSVEFRQGAFGWFQSRGLKTGDRLTDSGNFAMLDIKLALEWVRDNIGAFGGDNTNVTLSGFSAGARDVLNCMISPVMKGLFHKVISFSGGMTTCSIREGKKWSDEKLAKILVRRGRFSNKKRALKYVKRMSKSKLKKLLYSLTDKEIKKMVSSSSLRLTNLPQCFRDGAVIPREGFECMEWGEYNRVPAIIGSNRSEFANVSYKTMQRIVTKSPKTFKNKRQFYSLLKKSKEYGSKLQTSFYLEKLAIQISKDPYHSDLYTYRFQWGEDSSVTGADYARYVGSIHGMDLDFLLSRYKKGEKDTSHKIYNKSNRQGREALSSVMRQYMKNFLYTGNPNGTDADGKMLMAWNKWTRIPGAKRIMTFSATNTQAKTSMTSQYINRTRLKRKMKRNLSKKAYKFLKTRILNDRFFL